MAIFLILLICVKLLSQTFLINVFIYIIINWNQYKFPKKFTSIKNFTSDGFTRTKDLEKFELDLKFDAPIRWFAYRRLKDFKNMESIQKEMKQWVDELEKMKDEKIFDMSVANAMANDNVEMSIKKNT